MVKIISAFQGQSPVAQTISKLGLQLFDRSGDAADRFAEEKAYGQQIANTELENLMARAAGAEDYDAFWSDPANLAVALGSGVKSDDINNLFRARTASQYGIRNPQFEESYMGAGGNYGNLPTAFDANLAAENTRAANTLAETSLHNRNTESQAAINEQNQNTFRYAEPKPAMINGQPGFAPVGQLTQPGTAPILSDAETRGMYAQKNFGNMGELPMEEQTYIGADPSKAGTPKNYIVGDQTYITVDGVTNARDGQPLPPGGYIGTVQGTANDVLTKPAMSEIDQALIHINRTKTTSRMLRGVVERAPEEVFGASGKILNATRGAVVFADNIAGVLGAKDAFSARDMLKQEIAANPGISPDVANLIFSPTYGEMEVLAGAYIYQTAKALFGQGGRDISNQDIERVIGFLGSPNEWSMDKTRFLEKLTVADNLMAAQEETLRGMRAAVPTGPNVSPTANSPAPQTQPAPQPAPVGNGRVPPATGDGYTILKVR